MQYPGIATRLFGDDFEDLTPHHEVLQGLLRVLASRIKFATLVFSRDEIVVGLLMFSLIHCRRSLLILLLVWLWL